MDTTQPTAQLRGDNWTHISANCSKGRAVSVSERGTCGWHLPQILRLEETSETVLDPSEQTPSDEEKMWFFYASISWRQCLNVTYSVQFMQLNRTVTRTFNGSLTFPREHKKVSDLKGGLVVRRIWESP